MSCANVRSRDYMGVLKINTYMYVCKYVVYNVVAFFLIRKEMNTPRLLINGN